MTINRERMHPITYDHVNIHNMLLVVTAVSREREINVQLHTGVIVKTL